MDSLDNKSKRQKKKIAPPRGRDILFASLLFFFGIGSRKEFAANNLKPRSENCTLRMSLLVIY